jgi:hypothetical protein
MGESVAGKGFLIELAVARSIDLHDVGVLIVNQGMRPEEVIEIEKKNVDLLARTLRIPKGKTKAARRTLRRTAESFDVLKRRIQESEESEAKLKELCERVPKRMKVDPEKIAERERWRRGYVFPARRLGKRGKAHISLSGLENCHDDVLGCVQGKRPHDSIRSLRSSPHVRKQSGAGGNAPGNLGGDFGPLVFTSGPKIRSPHPSSSTDRDGPPLQNPPGEQTPVCGIVALPGPRQAHGEWDFGGFPQTGRERAGKSPMRAHSHHPFIHESTTVILRGCRNLSWRRGSESNRRIKVLQTLALPLGYRAGS